MKKKAEPQKFSSLVHQVVRDIYIEKNEVSSIDSIFERISSFKIQDVLHLNIFEDENDFDEESSAWTWCIVSLYRFMKSVGFVHEEIFSHYQ